MDFVLGNFAYTRGQKYWFQVIVLLAIKQTGFDISYGH